MPPPKGPIWSQFIELTNEQGTLTAVRCKHCDQKYSFPNTTRMTSHIIKCKKCPQLIKKTLSNNNLGESNEEDEDSPASVSNAPIKRLSSGDGSGPSSAVKRQRSITSCMDIISKEEKEKLDSLFARAILSKGLPFNVFDGEHMEAAFHALRPAYDLPDRRVFAGRLLDNEYKSVMKSVNENISKAKVLTVESDGWTNNRSEGIINFVVCTPKPYFYKSVEPGIDREDAQFVATEFLSVIDSVGAQKVLLLVTDNASTMRRAWTLVKEVYPHIYAIGCGAHSLNLLFKDIVKLPVFKALITKAKEIVKIRKRRQLNAVFKLKQKQNYGNNSTTLVLPSPTRFGGSYLMLASLQKNKMALAETVITQAAEVPPEVKRTVLDDGEDGFWPQLSFFVTFIEPVVEGTHLIEADDARLSHMVKICMKMKSLTNAALNENSVIPLATVNTIKEVVNYRIKKFCIFDIHLATYMIDPLFAGEGLSDNDSQRAIEVIEEIARYLKENEENVIENLAHFKTKSNFFSNEKIWNRALTMDSVTWWDFYCSNQPLHPIAIRLLSLLPSACPCERIWSEYGYVHNKVRNRLSNKKVEKEVAVKHNLNLTSEQSSSSEAKQKKKAKLTADRLAKIKAYPCVFLNDNNSDSEGSEYEEDEAEAEPLWTSDEELENTSDEENGEAEEDLQTDSDQ